MYSTIESNKFSIEFLLLVDVPSDICWKSWLDFICVNQFQLSQIHHIHMATGKDCQLLFFFSLYFWIESNLFEILDFTYFSSKFSANDNFFSWCFFFSSYLDYFTYICKQCTFCTHHVFGAHILNNSNCLIINLLI